MKNISKNPALSHTPLVRRISVAICALALFPTLLVAQTKPAEPYIDPNDAVMLLVDHQSGLFQTVKDISLPELRANAIILAKLGALAKVPVITTASEPNGPNGPIMPEIKQHAPESIYVARKGEISVWDNPDFVKAVKATNRKTLIIAGVWTSVCVAFPALHAKLEGYNVYAVIDASGDVSPMVSNVTLTRLAQAGVVPISTNAVASEFQRTWARPDAAQYGELYSQYAPNYQAVVESYNKAQEAARLVSQVKK